MNKELLACIADAVGCEEVEDLRAQKRFKKASFAVELIPENEYSLPEWNEAIHYLFRERAQPTKTKAKERLVLLLSRM